MACRLGIPYEPSVSARGISFEGSSKFAQRLGFSHSPGLINCVKFGLAWEVSAGGVGGIITVSSTAAMLTCKTQCFGNPNATTPHSCLRASDYQSIHVPAIMTFMFESIPLPDHPCAAITTFVLQLRPSTRNTAPSGAKSMSFREPAPCNSHGSFCTF